MERIAAVWFFFLSSLYKLHTVVYFCESLTSVSIIQLILMHVMAVTMGLKAYQQASIRQQNVLLGPKTVILLKPM